MKRKLRGVKVKLIFLQRIVLANRPLFSSKEFDLRLPAKEGRMSALDDTLQKRRELFISQTRRYRLRQSPNR
jgi:hypothetical protein